MCTCLPHTSRMALLLRKQQSRKKDSLAMRRWACRSGKTQVLVNYICRIYIHKDVVWIGDEDVFGAGPAYVMCLCLSTPYSRLERQSTKVDKPATVLRWACKPVKHVYVLFGWGMKVFWTTEKGNLFRPMSWASACQPPHFQAGASKKLSGPTGGAEVGIRSGKTQVLVNYIRRIYIYIHICLHWG